MAVKLYNEVELRKTISQLKPNGALFEVRIFSGKKVLSGYFKDADSLITALNTVDLRGATTCVTLNAVDKSLFSRSQSNKFIAGAVATSDKDIKGIQWLFVDMDPVRPSGISSSDEELKAATDLASKVYKFMQEIGFCEPVKALSGNGAHLLYRVSLSNTPENIDLIKKCLAALSFLFDSDEVKIDVANFNPARICKLYGTVAQKGANTEERPHRWSRILGDVKEIKVTDKAYIEKLAAEAPKEEEPIKPAKYNNYSPSEFDVEDWMKEHGLEVDKIADWNGATKYILSECPFDSNHKAPDSMIIKQPNGAIGFKCLHNSCHGKTWQDVRVMFEPDAYERQRTSDEEIELGYQRHKANREREMDYSSLIDKPKQPTFMSIRDILEMPEEKEVIIPTGIKEVDKRMRGLAKGKLTLLSGLHGAAKSTIINQMVLNARQHGFSSIVYSGELTGRNFAKWMLLQAAGRNHTFESSQYPGYFIARPEAKKRIADWLEGYVYVYNNEWGNKFEALKDDLIRQIQKTKADLVILDNLMALNIRDLNPYDKYDAQTQFINELSVLAKQTDTHILFVAHPKKVDGFLRLDDVSGSADLANMVDNALIIHRNNLDFKNKLTATFKSFKDTDPVFSGTNVIEIAKDRENGTQDVFVPLWYEKESKRLRNDPCEVVVYGWDTDSSDGFMDVAEEDMPWT